MKQARLYLPLFVMLAICSLILAMLSGSVAIHWSEIWTVLGSPQADLRTQSLILELPES